MSLRRIGSESNTEKFDLRLEELSLHNASAKKPLFTIKNFEIPTGTKILIEGPSGIGKSNFLHLLAGMRTPSAGKILFNQRDMALASESERANFRRDNMGIVFPSSNFIEHISVLENLLLALPRFDAEEVRARNLLSEMGLEKAADKRASTLNIGEQQRAAVARALLQDPKIILADEPTSALDDANCAVIAKALLACGPSKTVVVVSHDERLKKHFQKTVSFGDLISQ